MDAPLLILALLLAFTSAHAWCEPVPAPGGLDRLTQLYACSSVPAFMLGHAWWPVQVHVQCPTARVSVAQLHGSSQEACSSRFCLILLRMQLHGHPAPSYLQYTVYRGDSQELLWHNVMDRSAAFCGWERLLDGRTCRFQISPFRQTLIGMSSSSGGKETGLSSLMNRNAGSASLMSRRPDLEHVSSRHWGAHAPR